MAMNGVERRCGCWEGKFFALLSVEDGRAREAMENREGVYFVTYIDR